MVLCKGTHGVNQGGTADILLMFVLGSRRILSGRFLISREFPVYPEAINYVYSCKTMVQ